MHINEFKKLMKDKDICHLFNIDRQILKIGKLEIYKRKGKCKFKFFWNKYN